MAFKKERIKRQFYDVVSSMLQPGERVVGGSFTVSGPAPLRVMDMFALIDTVVLAFMFLRGMRNYFMVVTDRRIMFVRAGILSQRPARLAWVDPLSGASILDISEAEYGSRITYRKPDGSVVRLNFDRTWREEFRELVAAISPGRS